MQRATPGIAFVLTKKGLDTEKVSIGEIHMEQHNSSRHQPNNWALNTLGEAGDAICMGGSCNAPHRNRWNMTWAQRQHIPGHGALGIDAHDQSNARNTEDWCNEPGNTAHYMCGQQWKNIQIANTSN